MIQENHLWSSKDELSDRFDFDIWDSLSQGTRIISRPLKTDDDSQRSFASFRGRGVSIIHMGISLVREPFRLVKHVIVLVAQIFKTVLDILNFAFSERVRANFISRIKDTLGTAVGLALRPIAFALEILRYIGSIIVHPWIGIRFEHKDN